MATFEADPVTVTHVTGALESFGPAVIPTDAVDIPEELPPVAVFHGRPYPAHAAYGEPPGVTEALGGQRRVLEF